MKVLLIFPHVESIYGLPNYPPLGLAYLSSSLTKAGIYHEILDLRLYSDWKERFTKKLSECFEVIGITSTTFAFDKAAELAGIAKKNNPSCFVVLGGAHPTLVKEKVLKENKDMDIVIVGEGENAFVELCESWENKKNLERIDGIIFRKGKKIISNKSRAWNCNLDDLPFPNYDQFDLDKYHGDTSLSGMIKRRRILPILTSRGCPFECVYCSVYLTSGKKFRFRSPKNVVDEIEFMKKKYNAGIFDFLDDNFTLDIERAKEICRLLIKKKLNIQWGPPNGIRVDRIDEELVRLMKESGCNGVALGVESVSDRVLKNLKKHITLEQIQNAVSLFKKYRIPVKAFFLVGSPGGSEEEVRGALLFALKNNVDESRFSMLTPYPGTELYEWVTKNKYWEVKNPEEAILTFTHSGSFKPLYGEPGFSVEDKMRVYEDVTKEWDEYIRKKDFGLRFREWVVSKRGLYLFLKGIRDKLKK